MRWGGSREANAKVQHKPEGTVRADASLHRRAGPELRQRGTEEAVPVVAEVGEEDLDEEGEE